MFSHLQLYMEMYYNYSYLLLLVVSVLSIFTLCFIRQLKKKSIIKIFQQELKFPYVFWTCYPAGEVSWASANKDMPWIPRRSLMTAAFAGAVRLQWPKNQRRGKMRKNRPGSQWYHCWCKHAIQFCILISYHGKEQGPNSESRAPLTSVELFMVIIHGYAVWFGTINFIGFCEISAFLRFVTFRHQTLKRYHPTTLQLSRIMEA